MGFINREWFIDVCLRLGCSSERAKGMAELGVELLFVPKIHIQGMCECGGQGTLSLRPVELSEQGRSRSSAQLASMRVECLREEFG